MHALSGKVGEKVFFEKNEKKKDITFIFKKIGKIREI